ncbi:MAG: hypothetical protein JWP35_577 [Caulobacter sp.]|nr:hypothetical protein [Caulobacter sp.]
MQDANQLAQNVLREIDAFRPPPRHPKQLGVALPPEWFEAGVAEMREALVPPYPLQVLDYDSQPGAVIEREVWIVADDGDSTLLAFDPGPFNDFALIWRHEKGPALSNIRGDAVGCFLSR